MKKANGGSLKGIYVRKGKLLKLARFYNRELEILQGCP